MQDRFVAPMIGSKLSSTTRDRINRINYHNSRAPTDCVQYFTGISGNVQSYNFQGAQLLQGMNYKNCIRTEKGYCAIQWKQGHFSTYYI